MGLISCAWVKPPGVILLGVFIFRGEKVMSRGIPYSIQEAKLVLAKHKMDEYHRELFTFLVKSNEELLDVVKKYRQYEALSCNCDGCKAMKALKEKQDG
jgi:hypothetical protein